MDLAISIVTYNSEEFIGPCLESIFSNTRNISFEIWVVDNCSADSTTAIVDVSFPQVKLIRNETNVGFGRANNRVLEAVASRYCLVLNPDVVVSSGSLEAMVEFMDSHPDAGVLGCKLLNPDRTLQFSCRRYPRAYCILLRGLLLDRLSPDASALRRYFMADWDHGSLAQVDWVTAACMMFRQAALKDVGAFDQRFFMYYEDVDVCRRIAEKWKVYYDPRVQMIHHHRQESHQPLNLTCRLRHVKSAYRYFQKWGT